MADSEGQEKKHAPSDRKWEQAAEKGQIPKSQDLASAAVILAGGVSLIFLSGYSGEQITGLFSDMMDFGAAPGLDHSEMLKLGEEAMVVAAKMIAIPLGAVAVASLAVNLAQSRFQLSTKALEPKWERLDAASNFKQQYLSSTPAMELVKGLGKLVALGGVLVWAMRDRFDEIPAMAALEPYQVLAFQKEISWQMVTFALPLVLAIGAADYGYTYWKQYTQLMRTDKEMRDEAKESEGDPYLRAARRRRAMEIAHGSRIQAVKDADVLITNPTHFAVALRYRRGEDDAPVVLAKGMDHLALKMRKIALENGVPRVEDRPLARALYKRVKPGQGIPEELYGPVARILAMVFKRRARRRR
ncbi:MAG: EscU/YscU/HrcU family type III secretion system export apparatus switch protein [Deltaproteobacteria bacterium]|nr:EscU/YscU/HrcU family type III secretion system export apparatus switch protein [Deltaproteobacteria bacterium]